MYTRITKQNCHEKLGHLWCAMMMPFEEDGSLDLEGARKNIRYLLQNKVPCIAFPVGVAEIWSVTTEEYQQMCELVVQEVKGRAIVVAGAAYFTAPILKEMAQIAQRAGIDGLMVDAPANPACANDDDTYEHFKQVAESTDLAIMLYQGNCRRPLTMELLERLVQIPNVVGYKELPYNPTYFYNLARGFGDKIVLINGRRGEGELRMMFYREAGAHGYWSALMLFCPELAWQHWNAWKARDYTTIREICARTAPFFDLYSDMYDEFMKTPSINNLVAYKLVMDAVGLAGGYCRSPYPKPTAAQREMARQALEKMGIGPVKLDTHTTA